MAPVSAPQHAAPLRVVHPDREVETATTGHGAIPQPAFKESGHTGGGCTQHHVELLVHSPSDIWKFCWSGGGGTHIELIAHLLDRMDADGEAIDWWERATPDNVNDLGAWRPEEVSTKRSVTHRGCELPRSCHRVPSQSCH